MYVDAEKSGRRLIGVRCKLQWLLVFKVTFETKSRKVHWNVAALFSPQWWISEKRVADKESFVFRYVLNKKRKN